MNLIKDYERKYLRLFEKTSRRRDTAIIERDKDKSTNQESNIVNIIVIIARDRDRDRSRYQRFIIITNDNDSTSIISAATMMLTRQIDIEICIFIAINAISESRQNTLTTHDSNITSYISSLMSQTIITSDSRRSDRLRNRQNRTQQ